MLLREDLYSPRHIADKLRRIAAKREPATLALLTAFRSQDLRMRTAGLRGITSLKLLDAIPPLLSTWNDKSWPRRDVMDALVTLAAASPIGGDEGLLRIHAQLAVTADRAPLADFGDYLPPLESLLNTATSRRGEFAPGDYDRLLDWYDQCADDLNWSGDRRARYAGEALKTKLERLRLVPDWPS